MSSDSRRIVITRQTKQESPLPTCTPNLMPFHIKYTGAAPVSMFLRVEKPTIKGEGEVKEQNDENKEAMVVDVEVKSDSITPVNLVHDQVQPTDAKIKDTDERFISSFRGRTIHGLTVDVPTGYTGLLLQGDPPPTVTVATGGLEGEDVDKGGRNTRSKSKGVVGKGKGKAKEKETTKTAPKGRLARTAAPKRPEVIAVDNEDQEMAGPAPTELTAEASDHLLDLKNDYTNAPDDSINNNDLEVDKAMSLRKLIPQSTFSSITLWHADRAVDETRDEYYRTLTEWMALSHEIHRTDL